MTGDKVKGTVIKDKSQFLAAPLIMREAGSRGGTVREDQ